MQASAPLPRACCRLAARSERAARHGARARAHAVQASALQRAGWEGWRLSWASSAMWCGEREEHAFVVM